MLIAEHNTGVSRAKVFHFPADSRSDDIIHIDERDFSVCPIPPTIADISSGRTGGRARLNCNKNEVGTSLVGQGVARALGDLRFKRERHTIARDTDRCNYFPFTSTCIIYLSSGKIQREISQISLPNCFNKFILSRTYVIPSCHVICDN